MVLNNFTLYGLCRLRITAWGMKGTILQDTKQMDKQLNVFIIVLKSFDHFMQKE